MKLILALLFALAFSSAHARTLTLNVPDSGCITVRHLSVPGGNALLDTFDATSFDSVTGNIWNFSGTCNTPPPPVDPGAYTNMVVNWLVFPSTPPRSTDVRVFGNIFGRINSNVPAVGWDFANGATVQLQDNSSKYYRMHVSIPPGTPPSTGHFLKAVSYGKSPANLHAKFAIVATGAPWPTGAANGCYTPDSAFGDFRVLNINFNGPPNTSKCSVGNEFDVLADAIGNGTMALSWQ